MTHQQILEKAISKAIDGGWAPFNDRNDYHPKEVMEWWESPNMYIFNHDFCKAIFGTNEVCFNCGLEGKHDPYCAEQTFYDEVWKYRLREMVLEDDPIEYLGNNL